MRLMIQQHRIAEDTVMRSTWRLNQAKKPFCVRRGMLQQKPAHGRRQRERHEPGEGDGDDDGDGELLVELARWCRAETPPG